MGSTFLAPNAGCACTKMMVIPITLIVLGFIFVALTPLWIFTSGLFFLGPVVMISLFGAAMISMCIVQQQYRQKVAGAQQRITQLFQTYQARDAGRLIWRVLVNQQFVPSGRVYYNGYGQQRMNGSNFSIPTIQVEICG